jgi:hypothetical protein
MHERGPGAQHAALRHNVCYAVQRSLHEQRRVGTALARGNLGDDALQAP